LIFKKNAFLYSALIIGLAGILSFYVSEKIDLVWSKLSQILATGSNYILLTVIFLVVVTPAAMLRRLFGKNKFWGVNKNAQSNFSDRNHTFEKIDMEKLW
jgi:hypothetical protein